VNAALAAQLIKADMIALIEKVRTCEELAKAHRLDGTLSLRLESARHELESALTLSRLALRQFND
jgi:hypothetical protein